MAAKVLRLLVAGWALSPTSLLAQTAASQSGQPKATVWAQPEAPVELLGYSVLVATDRSGFLRPGAHHNLEYRNRGGRPVQAVGFALLSFDLWNEMVGGCEALTHLPLPAEGSRTTRWVDEAGASVPFAASVALVHRVRFADGKVWRTDDWRLLEELQQAGLVVSSLTLPVLTTEAAWRGPSQADRPGTVPPGQAPAPPPGGEVGGGGEEPIDTPAELPEPPGSRQQLHSGRRSP